MVKKILVSRGPWIFLWLLFHPVHSLLASLKTLVNLPQDSVISLLSHWFLEVWGGGWRGVREPAGGRRIPQFLESFISLCPVTVSSIALKLCSFLWAGPNTSLPFILLGVKWTRGWVLASFCHFTLGVSGATFQGCPWCSSYILLMFIGV